MWVKLVMVSARRKESLRIGWITGDLSPHPVSRFLLGFFSAFNKGNAQHQHHLINVLDHGPRSCVDWFEPIQSLQLTDISAHPIQGKVAAVRELDLDIAIDLSGWTSGHFLGGFLGQDWRLCNVVILVFLHPRGSRKLITGWVIGVCSRRITPGGTLKHFGGSIVLSLLGNR